MRKKKKKGPFMTCMIEGSLHSVPGIWFQLLAHVPKGVGHKCQMQDIKLLLVDASYF